MTFQWGKNPDYTITTWYDLTNWKLPFGVNWRWFTGLTNANSFGIEFMFLCFGVQFEIWWWRKTKMKTKEQITKEIEALKTVRPNVRPTTFFGDDNLAALDAQIQVLEEDLDEDGIWDEWPEEEQDQHVRDSARQAVDWVNDEEDSDSKGLADEWPLKKEGD